LETRRWNGTKSAFADCTLGFVAPPQRGVILRPGNTGPSLAPIVAGPKNLITDATRVGRGSGTNAGPGSHLNGSVDQEARMASEENEYAGEEPPVDFFTRLAGFGLRILFVYPIQDIVIVWPD
jgi:hypothetical protein